jgi:hypothetical protein
LAVTQERRDLHRAVFFAHVSIFVSALRHLADTGDQEDLFMLAAYKHNYRPLQV